MFTWCGSGALGESAQVGELQRAFESLCFCCYSVAKSHLTLCDSMNCNTPGFLVLHYLPEFAQIYIHWVSLPRYSPAPSPWQTLIYFRSLWSACVGYFILVESYTSVSGFFRVVWHLFHVIVRGSSFLFMVASDYWSATVSHLSPKMDLKTHQIPDMIWRIPQLCWIIKTNNIIL